MQKIVGVLGGVLAILIVAAVVMTHKNSVRREEAIQAEQIAQQVKRQQILAEGENERQREAAEKSAVKISDESLITGAKAWILEMLKDPDSLQFKVEKIARSAIIDPSNYERYDVVCGSFNAKNSYGGYTGYKSFMYSKAGGQVVTAEISPSFSNPDGEIGYRNWLKACNSN